VNNVRCELPGTKEWICEKLSVETSNKDRNIRNLYRCTYEFHKAYQRRTNVVKYENHVLLPDSNSILYRWKN